MVDVEDLTSSRALERHNAQPNSIADDFERSKQTLANPVAHRGAAHAQLIRSETSPIAGT